MAYLGRISPIVLLDQLPGHGLVYIIHWIGNIGSYKCKVTMLNTILRSRSMDIVSFEGVLRKAMARFELHREMRGKYAAAVAKWYRDFINIARS